MMWQKREREREKNKREVLVNNQTPRPTMITNSKNAKNCPSGVVHLVMMMMSIAKTLKSYTKCMYL